METEGKYEGSTIYVMLIFNMKVRQYMGNRKFDGSEGQETIRYGPSMYLVVRFQPPPYDKNGGDIGDGLR